MSIALSQVLAYSRAQLQTDSIGLSDANGIIFANEALQDFHRQLIMHGVDASQIQEAYRDMTVNVGTYLYPTDMFFLKTIELNYVNTNAQDYKTAQQIDVSNIAGGNSFSFLRQSADRNNPQFDDRGDWYEIFPTPTAADNLSQAIRLMYFLTPTEYTSTADTLSYPETLDYRLIAWRIAANYLYSLGSERIAAGDKFDSKYQQKVAELIKTLSRGSQQPLEATPIPLTGYEF